MNNPMIIKPQPEQAADWQVNLIGETLHINYLRVAIAIILPSLCAISIEPAMFQDPMGNVISKGNMLVTVFFAGSNLVRWETKPDLAKGFYDELMSKAFPQHTIQ